jgi:hypothetical protein
MTTRRCAICGKEFELHFGDTRFTDKCPTMGLKQYDSAASQFREAVALDPKSPSLQSALGQAQLKAAITPTPKPLTVASSPYIPTIPEPRPRSLTLPAKKVRLLLLPGCGDSQPAR